MANVHCVVSVHLIDDNGDPGRVALFDNPADTTTLASLVTKVSTMAGELENIVDGQILKGSVSIEFPLTAGKSAPVAGCDIEKGGKFQWSVAGTTYKASTFIPTMSPDLFNGDDVIVGGPTEPVGAWVANMVANWFDKYDHDITSLVSAVKRFRK